VRPHGVLKNWIDDGALAAVRVGARRVRVRRIDLDAYLAAGRTTQRAVRLSTEAEARTALRYAMAQTGAALDGESNTDLAQALSDLRSAGGRLTRILSRNDGE
jgi:excisionase family DNA binding protein